MPSFKYFSAFVYFLQPLKAAIQAEHITFMYITVMFVLYHYTFFFLPHLVNRYRFLFRLEWKAGILG